MSSQRTALHTWLQLLRAPNLFTVPGDALAGFLLASGGIPHPLMLAVMLASMCFYGAGLLLNDLADLEEDRRERPNRPLPSGAADPRIVRIATGILACAGLLLCLVRSVSTLQVGLLLLAFIATYNLWAKKFPVLGPLNMGACRGLSLQLGAWIGLHGEAHWQSPAVASTIALAPIATAGLTLYIALVTNLARVETQAQPSRLPRALPFVGLLLAVVPFFCFAIDRAHPFEPFNVALYALSAYTLYAGFKIHRRLMHEPAPPIPPMIGQFIRLLLPLQAVGCVASRGLTGAIAAVILLVLWPVSRSVSKRFYAS